jgi:hypothetical protein
MGPMRRIRGTFVVIVALALTGLVAGRAGGQALRIGQAAPEIAGEAWINTEPLTMAGLRGQVVFVEFWTYG